jgi:nucleoside-diphosphate-sugar epimerase
VSLKESDAWPAEVTIISGFLLQKTVLNSTQGSLFCTDGINGQESIHPGYREDLRSIMKHVGSGGGFNVQPQDAYGLEKLATEELCKHYTKDFKMECRIGRFHNIYGPFGTWKGNKIIFLLSMLQFWLLGTRVEDCERGCNKTE